MIQLTKNEKVILSVIGGILLAVLAYNWYGNHYCTWCAIPVKCTGGC